MTDAEFIDAAMGRLSEQGLRELVERPEHRFLLLDRNHWVKYQGWERDVGIVRALRNTFRRMVARDRAFFEEHGGDPAMLELYLTLNNL